MTADDKQGLTFRELARQVFCGSRHRDGKAWKLRRQQGRHLSARHVGVYIWPMSRSRACESRLRDSVFLPVTTRNRRLVARLRQWQWPHPK
jgi:hypothetical protein